MKGKVCHRRWQTVAVPEKDAPIRLQANSATASPSSLESRNELVGKGTRVQSYLGLRRQLPYFFQVARASGMNLTWKLRCYLQERLC